jgi:hypothetical protein
MPQFATLLSTILTESVRAAACFLRLRGELDNGWLSRAVEAHLKSPDQ